MFYKVKRWVFQKHSKAAKMKHYCAHYTIFLWLITSNLVSVSSMVMNKLTLCIEAWGTMRALCFQTITLPLSHYSPLTVGNTRQTPWTNIPTFITKIIIFVTSLQAWNKNMTPLLHSMMTSSNGNIFRVTGHLCVEFTGQRWIPRTKASDAELWCFSLICDEKTVK